MSISSSAKRTTVICLLGVTASPLMAVSAATAADTAKDYDKGWYIGMNIGRSASHIDDEENRRSLEDAGFVVSSIESDSRDRGYKLLGGYQFTRYIALEGGYFDLGNFNFLANTIPDSNFIGETDVKGLNLDVVGTLPFTEHFSGFGRLGMIYNDSDTKFSSNGLIDESRYNESKRYTKYKFGLGLQYQFNPALGIRLEMERYRVNDLIGNSGDIDLPSLGLIYRFGAMNNTIASRTTEPAVRSTSVVTPPVVIAEERVIILEDVHFDFDTSTLTPETRAILKNHVKTLKANPGAQVRIAGYTSASGTKEYNQRLSERRAQAIKDYLVSEGVVLPDRLTTIGFGENRPAEYEADPSVIESNAANANMRVLFEIIVD